MQISPCKYKGISQEKIGNINLEKLKKLIDQNQLSRILIRNFQSFDLDHQLEWWSKLGSTHGIIERHVLLMDSIHLRK